MLDSGRIPASYHGIKAISTPAFDHRNKTYAWSKYFLFVIYIRVNWGRHFHKASDAQFLRAI